MKISARLAREAMLNRDGLNHLQVELIPPVVEEGAPSKPVLMVFVIDRSGSMGGNLNRVIHEAPYDEVRYSSKMSYAISAVTNFLHLLTEDDLVGVVSFDDSAEINQHLTRLNPSTRRSVIANVQGIQPRGCTNISDAILTAKRMITAAHLDEYTCKIILLSDGIANRGVSDSDGLASVALSCLREGITVSSLGIGADYDAGIMGAIANSGGGLFYHILNFLFFSHSKLLISSHIPQITPQCTRRLPYSSFYYQPPFHELKRDSRSLL
ncbi:MAG: VWA domain-containing protein [Clostridiales bacterium]|nr:VWA domain-containing protein [Clostridiales bacterium]